MKKYRIYLMTLLAQVMVFSGCTDKTDSYGDDGRLFMPMFRLQANTNNSSDRYACNIASNIPDCGSTHVNDIMLYWYGVNGATGYRIKSKIQGTDWDKNCVLDTIVNPETLEILHPDIQYSTGYSYAIQAISPKGDAYNSKWYGYGDGSHQNDYVTITTGERYDVPNVFWVQDVTKETMRVYFNQTAESGYENTYKDFIEAGAQVSNDKWVFDEIRVEPSADNPDFPGKSHKMTDADFANGYVDFNGLTSNAAYIVTGQNNNVKRYFDRQYNKIMVRMQGEPGKPIIIPAKVDPNDTILAQSFATGLQATRIDTVLVNYMGDNSMAEGQIFYLEGGKTYYMQTSVELTKGFTLETNPADLASGKGRATVYLGVGTTTEAGIQGNACNFMLGRNAKSSAENGVMLTLQAMKFNNIDFSVHKYFNYMDKNGTDGNSLVTVTQNYFMNMSSQGLSFSLSELSIKNCTFSGMVRGFIRFQGPNREIIEKLTLDGCVFYDCGVYDVNGRGYSWFAGPGSNKNSNFFQHLSITNNSFIDCPRHAFVSENNNLAWPVGTTWDIDIENNTFINVSSRSKDRLLIETQYPPSGSKFTIKKNLFVQVNKGSDDSRNLYISGMKIKSRDITYDFSDNYATTVPAWSTKKLTDGLFTSNAFSDSQNGAGYLSGALNANGYGETQIKFGDNLNGNENDGVGYELTPEDLFKNPAPKAANGYKDMHRYDINGFYYNNSSKVKSHPIFTKQIGDQRWATGTTWK
ncbi:hypothetical protein [Xylanibacter oryzae]|uniref:hypothetical protein n=1 Tax=Xylanibacter oryzae TaxID=185293 RepID=UPI0012B58363|nr:hypothetical protein [Xylanibacter oryzae]